MDTVEQMNENFNAKKSKKKGFVVVLVLLLLIAVVAVLVYYFMFANKPQKIFNKAIDNIFSMEEDDFSSVKIDTKTRLSTDLKDSTYNEYLKELEKMEFKFGTQMDVKEKKEIVDIGLNYDTDSVIDAKVYYNDGNMYAYFDQIYDKYIELDMDEEQLEMMEKIFETAADKEDRKNSQKVREIIRDELKAGLKEYGTFESEKETVQLGDKEKKLTKSTVTLSEKDLMKLLSNMCSNLSENDKFVKYVEDTMEDNQVDIVDELENLADELKSQEKYAGKSNLRISIYSTGIKNDIKGVEFEIYVEDEEMTVIASLMEDKKDSYSYKVSMKNDMLKADLVKGTVVFEKDKDTKKEKSGKVEIVADIANAGKIKVETDYSIEYNKGVDSINTRNSVKLENITQTEQEEIIKKLQERPLIGEFIGASMNSPIIETPSNPTTPILPSANVTTKENQVKDYGYLVTFSVPNGFKLDDTYTVYDFSKDYKLESNNEDIEADISLIYSTEERYKMDEINWEYDYYFNNSTYYKNIKLDDEKTIRVGDNEFKYQILSYEDNLEYYQEKHQKAFVWYKLDDNHMFTVELEADDTGITEDMIKGFLNINVEKTY